MNFVGMNHLRCGMCGGNAQFPHLIMAYLPGFPGKFTQNVINNFEM